MSHSKLKAHSIKGLTRLLLLASALTYSNSLLNLVLNLPSSNLIVVLYYILLYILCKCGSGLTLLL